MTNTHHPTKSLLALGLAAMGSLLLASTETTFRDVRVFIAGQSSIEYADDEQVTRNQQFHNSSNSAAAGLPNITTLSSKLVNFARENELRDKTETFSACLLIKDDNHRLPEWLAYHYFALPLRYLVVAVDPHSVTSPSSIFDEWRDRMNMTIVQWTDSNFTGKNLIIKPDDSPKRRTGKHRERQQLFFQACTRYLQGQNRTWTAYIDVDEYFVLNSDLVSNSQQLSRQPGYVLREVNNLRQNNTNILGDTQSFWFRHFQQSHCVTLPRVLIVSCGKDFFCNLLEKTSNGILHIDRSDSFSTHA